MKISGQYPSGATDAASSGGSLLLSLISAISDFDTLEKPTR